MYTRIDLIENRKMNKIIKKNKEKEYNRKINKFNDEYKTFSTNTSIVVIIAMTVIIPIVIAVVENINF